MRCSEKENNVTSGKINSQSKFVKAYNRLLELTIRTAEPESPIYKYYDRIRRGSTQEIEEGSYQLIKFIGLNKKYGKKMRNFAINLLIVTLIVIINFLSSF